MAFELEGKLIEQGTTQQITDTFKKREFVIESKQANGGREFIDYIKFQVMQNKCDLLDSFPAGCNVKVSFNVKGTKYEKNGDTNYFTNLNAWKIESVDIFDNAAPTQEEHATAVNSDDLPF